MLEISGVHHVALIVSDYARSKHFYSKVLGLTVVAESHRAERDSWKLDLLVGGKLRLELFSFPNPPPRLTRPEACGLRHIAYRVADLEAAVRCLQSAFVLVEGIRTDECTGRRFTFCADPDGLPLELYEQ